VGYIKQKVIIVFDELFGEKEGYNNTIHTYNNTIATAKIESVWNVNNNQESQKRKQGIENKHTKS